MPSNGEANFHHVIVGRFNHANSLYNMFLSDTGCHEQYAVRHVVQHVVPDDALPVSMLYTVPCDTSTTVDEWRTEGSSAVLSPTSLLCY